jgi:hypothetical protein
MLILRTPLADYKVPDGTLVNMHLQPTPPQKSAAANPAAAKPSEEGRQVLCWEVGRPLRRPFRHTTLFRHCFVGRALPEMPRVSPSPIHPSPDAAARSLILGRP